VLTHCSSDYEIGSTFQVVEQMKIMLMVVMVMVIMCLA
jgi:hypothetical protein